GANSLACVCAKDSPFTDPNSSTYNKNLPKCTDEFMKNYTVTVRIDRNHANDPSADTRIPYHPDDKNMTTIQYTVNVPYGYSFRGMCDPRQFQPGYQPPFIDPENLG